MYDIYFYTWKLEPGQRDLVNRIGTTLDNLLDEETNKTIIEIISYGEVMHSNGWGIVFDHITHVIDDTNGQIIELPNLCLLTNDRNNKNKDFRSAAFESLEMLAKAIKGYTKPEKTKIEVVTQEGCTISKQNSDFNITDQEIEYIKKVRDLLDCSQIKITKGDLIVELK
jgi:hypothetical protein